MVLVIATCTVSSLCSETETRELKLHLETLSLCTSSMDAMKNDIVSMFYKIGQMNETEVTILSKLQGVSDNRRYTERLILVSMLCILLYLKLSL